ncbi:MAG: hypothetical protein RIA65_18130, partial [Woeseia sp.]
VAAFRRVCLFLYGIRYIGLLTTERADITYSGLDVAEQRQSHGYGVSKERAHHAFARPMFSGN